VGRFTGKGAAVSFGGALYFQIASKKLAPADQLEGVVDNAADEHPQGFPRRASFGLRP
jgi:hypothetical protein